MPVFSHILSRRVLPYTIIVVTYMAGFMAAALWAGNKEFLFYGGTMIVMIGVLVFMDRRVRFSHGVLAGFTVWGFLHLAGGTFAVPLEWTDPGEMTPVLYDVRIAPFLPKYDQCLHAFGFGLCAVTAHQALQAHLGRALPINWPVGAALFFIATGLGALNEMIEFTAVMMIADTHVGGYDNTGWDMVSNAVGALIAIGFLGFRSCRKRTG